MPVAVRRGPAESELSLAERIARLPEIERRRVLAETFPDDDAATSALYDWRFWGRPKQLLPLSLSEFVILLRTGRGFGKTRTGAETVNAWAHDFSPIALVGSTVRDCRQVMVEGEDTYASILETAPPWWRPTYEPSKTKLTWPNGSVAFTYGADQPETFRGPQHAKAWLDELAKWRRLKEAWQNIVFGMRLGSAPQVIVTTTPRPKKLIRELALRDSTKVIAGSMYENVANLAPVFVQEIEGAYGGTRTGRQEIEGEQLDEVEGALWQRTWIDAARVERAPESLQRVVVAIDPAASSGPESNDTGIIVAGMKRDEKGVRRFYVLADLTCHLPPEGWARVAADAYERYHADRIVGEVNNGGEMVAAVVRVAAPKARFKMVHASRGKVIRAEPITLLYEQGRVHHVGALDALEDQMCVFTSDSADTTARLRELGADDGGGSESPDRVDALVWCLTELDKGSSWGSA